MSTSYCAGSSVNFPVMTSILYMIGQELPHNRCRAGHAPTSQGNFWSRRMQLAPCALRFFSVASCSTMRADVIRLGRSARSRVSASSHGFARIVMNYPFALQDFGQMHEQAGAPAQQSYTNSHSRACMPPYRVSNLPPGDT